MGAELTAARQQLATTTAELSRMNEAVRRLEEQNSELVTQRRELSAVAATR